MGKWISENDLAFYLNCLIQIISLIYITKVCFIGKTSVIGNIANVIACIILLPVFSFILLMMLLDHVSSMEGVILLHLLIVAVFTALYTFICARKNRTLAAFTYLMFYMVSIYGVSLVMNSVEGTANAVIQIIIVCAIQFLFCYFILPQIVILSKEGRGLARERCKKSKKGKLGSQDCWISATDRQLC